MPPCHGGDRRFESGRARHRKRPSDLVGAFSINNQALYYSEIMTNTRKFFHDRFVLFVLTVNAFLASVSIISVMARIGGADENYIQFFRSNLGLNAFTVGGVSEIISFPIFAAVVFAAHIVFALKFYEIRKSAGWAIMVMTTLLLLLCLIVSNALLELR
jgi:hypothetical protein